MPCAATLRRDTCSVLVTIAWRRYLAALRRCESGTYEVIEELAWSHLLDEHARIQSIYRYGEHRAQAVRPHTALDWAGAASP